MEEQKERKSLKEIIDALDTKFYETEIENLKKEIYNIEMNRPRYEGIHKLVGEIVPENKKEEEIKGLKTIIEEDRKIIKEVTPILQSINFNTHKLEELIKIDMLLNIFSVDFDKLFDSQKLVDEKMVKSIKKFQKKYKQKYLNLYFSCTKPIEKQKQKLSKQLYELLKTVLKRHLNENQDRYLTVDFVLDDNLIPFTELDLESKIEEYVDKSIPSRKSWLGNIKDFSEFGVNNKKIDAAYNISEGKIDFASLIADDWIVEAFKNLENINTIQKLNISTKLKDSDLGNLREQYIKITELSKSVLYIEAILDAFKSSTISSSELSEIKAGYETIVRKQKTEIKKLAVKAKKLYEKSQLQEKIDLMQHLEELHAKSQELQAKIEQFKNLGDLDKVNALENEYYRTQREMYNILKENPKLNNTKYNINIKNEKDENKDNLQKPVEETVNNPVKEEPSVKATNEENAKETVQKPVEENKKIQITKENIELNSNLQMQRTMHYQNYMREKVLKSDLGNLSFSEYLESVAPNLKELIDIEKKRETFARTIYKEYLKYYSSLEDKKSVIPFEEFAENKYGISNIDVPIENEEEYKGMMSR